MHYLECVHIAEQANKLRLKLSGGKQQQRSNCALSLYEAETLLFDEWSICPRPEMINEVLDVMVELAAVKALPWCAWHTEMGTNALPTESSCAWTKDGSWNQIHHRVCSKILNTNVLEAFQINSMTCWCCWRWWNPPSLPWYKLWCLRQPLFTDTRFWCLKAMGYSWQWDRVPDYIAFYEDGEWWPAELMERTTHFTINISLISLVATLVISLTQPLLRNSNSVVDAPSLPALVELIRNTPLLVQITCSILYSAL